MYSLGESLPLDQIHVYLRDANNLTNWAQGKTLCKNHTLVISKNDIRHTGCAHTRYAWVSLGDMPIKPTKPDADMQEHFKTSYPFKTSDGTMRWQSSLKQDNQKIRNQIPLYKKKHQVFEDHPMIIRMYPPEKKYSPREKNDAQTENENQVIEDDNYLEGEETHQWLNF